VKTRHIVLVLAGFGFLYLTGCAGSPPEKAARFMSRGKAYAEKHDYTRAAIEFHNATRATPKEPEPYYQLALVYLQQDRTREAVGLLRQAVALDPKHTGAQLKLTEIMLQAPAADPKAEERVNQILASHPDDTDALFVKAAIEARLGKAEDAEQYLQKALEESPQFLKSSLALAVMKIGKRDLAGAEETLRKAVAQSPQSADAELALGKFYDWRGKRAEAETAFKQAVELDPASAPALMSLGAIYQKTSRGSDAEAIYKRVSALPGREYKPVYGVYLAVEGRLDQAIAEMEKLCKSDPEDRPARDLLVATYLKANRFDTAQKLLDDVLKKNPKDTDALLQRSRMAITAGKLTQAMNQLTTLLGFEPNSASAHYFIARVHELRGALQQQRQHLGEAVRLAPRWLAARIELATALIASGNGKAALDTLAAASDQEKRSIDFLVAWNWALMNTGDLAGARKGVDRGLALAKTPDLYLQDGVLKMNAKNYEGARASVQQSLEGNPGDLRALNALIEIFVAEKRPEDGIGKLSRYVAQRPPSAANQVFLAEWLLKFGQTPDARAALEKGAALDARNTTVQLMLAQLDLQDRSFDTARKRLTAILANEPDEPRAHLLMASLETLNGDYSKAIEHYRIPADKGNIAAINNLAYNLAKDDSQLNAALKYAEMAKQIAPDDSHVEDTLGWIYYRKGLYQRAVAELETALAKDSRPGVKLHLGLAYLKLGDKDKGRKLAMEAVAADPTLPVNEVALVSK
jgi:tetratricopeptide (TPR) repeat protein